MFWRERGLPLLAGAAGLALVGWLAARDAATELGGQELSIARVAQNRLDGTRRDVSDWLLGVQDALWRDLDGADDRKLDSLARAHPLAVAAFRSVRGRIVFPDTSLPGATLEQRAFLQRTERLWSGRAVITAAPRREGAGESGGLEWIPWHWEDGLHFVVRRPLDDTTEVGLEIDRTALLSRLVGEVMPRDLGGGSIELVDGTGRLLHRWGSHVPDSASEGTPLASGRLGSPFENWSLEVHGLEAVWGELSREISLRNILLRWGLAATLWIVAVFLVSREWTRTLREARLKTGFVQQVSHELRTPLTNIRLHAELARDGTLEDDTFRHLEVVGQETERLSRLVANILTFARSEKGPLKIQPSLVDVRALLDGALAPFAPAAARSGVRIETRLAPEESHIYVDPDAATQILQNLVGNALKYAWTGKWVGITLVGCSNRWEIRVQDLGRGIPASHREHIFQPFFRLSDRINEGVAGTGIGLGIARDLARGHGGELRLETGTAGCTFLWILPRPA